MRVMNDEWRWNDERYRICCGVTHKTQSRSGDNKACLLRCGVMI